jgi:hypothetical protein
MYMQHMLFIVHLIGYSVDSASCVYLRNKDQPEAFFSIYFSNHPLHVSNIDNHQEVLAVYATYAIYRVSKLTSR